MPEEVIKFTKEELEKVQEIQNEYFNIQTQLGQISIAKIRLEEQLKSLDNAENTSRKNFDDIQGKERKFLEEVTKKYGDGTLNPETGVFTKNKSK